MRLHKQFIESGSKISAKHLLQLVTIETGKGGWFKFVTSLCVWLSIFLYFASDGKHADAMSLHKQFKAGVSQSHGKYSTFPLCKSLVCGSALPESSQFPQSFLCVRLYCQKVLHLCSFPPGTHLLVVFF